MTTTKIIHCRPVPADLELFSFRLIRAKPPESPHSVASPFLAVSPRRKLLATMGPCNLMSPLYPGNRKTLRTRQTLV